MRSKMLGLAIALSTFGLGVAATTVWIAQHTSPAPQEIVTTRTVFVPNELLSSTEPLAPCDAKGTGVNNQINIDPITTVIRGGDLNDKATIKPAPIYPASARAAQASGMVVVQITVDQCGNVVWAKAVSGHSLLQQAAVNAAYKWHFHQMFVDGKPVEVSGKITFNFLLQ
jgi:TonB family protein